MRSTSPPLETCRARLYNFVNNLANSPRGALAPDLLGRLDHQAQLRPLVLVGQLVALDGRREAALRRQAELVDVHVLRRLLDAPLEQVLALELGLLCSYKAEHHLLALGHEAQRLERARARVV